MSALLIHDAEGSAESLAEAGQGDDVSVKGDIAPFQVPGEGWEAVRPLLRDTTYQLDVDGLDGLVLVTGLPADLEPDTVVVEGGLLHAGPHPLDPDRTLFVVLAKDVHEPAVFR